MPYQKKFKYHEVTFDEYFQFANITAKPQTKSGRNGWWRVDGHDSLYVNFDKNCFKWYGHNTQGKLAKFISEYEGLKSQNEVVARLKSCNQAIKQGNIKQSQPTKNDYVAKPVEPFDLSKYQLNPIAKETRDYLTKTRKLDETLVNHLIDGKLIQQWDQNYYGYKNHHCLFVWKNEQGQPIGADVQGTKPIKNKQSDKHQGYLKMVATGSPADKKGFNFQIGKKGAIPDKIYAFEAPIDALSFYQMNNQKLKGHNVKFITGKCNEKVLLNYVLKDVRQMRQQQHAEAQPFPEIHLATDNDKAGREYVDRVAKLLDGYTIDDQNFKVYRDVPADLNCKDWNDQLVAHGNEPSVKEVMDPINHPEKLALLYREDNRDDKLQSLDKDLQADRQQHRPMGARERQMVRQQEKELPKSLAHAAKQVEHSRPMPMKQPNFMKPTPALSR